MAEVHALEDAREARLWEAAGAVEASAAFAHCRDFQDAVAGEPEWAAMASADWADVSFLGLEGGEDGVDEEEADGEDAEEGVGEEGGEEEALGCEGCQGDEWMAEF